MDSRYHFFVLIMYQTRGIAGSLAKLFCSVTAFFFVLTVSSSYLRAQVLLCEGSCPDIIADESDVFGQLLQEDYARRLAFSFAGAHALANLGMVPYIGSVNLNYATLGYQMDVSTYDQKKLTLNTPGGKSIQEASIVGTAAQGLIFIGVNMGNTLKLIPGWGSLDILKGVELYLGNGSSKATFKDLFGYDSQSFSSNASYVGLHYQFLEPIGLSALFSWQGLSVNVGQVSSSMNVTLEEEDEDELERFIIAGFGWKAENEIDVDSKMTSTIAELSTGARMFYFLSLTTGVGISYHSGETRVSFLRDGFLYLNGSESDTRLKADFSNRDMLEDYRIPYYKLGIEFNVPFFHIGTQLTVNGNRLYSISLGLRADI